MPQFDVVLKKVYSIYTINDIEIIQRSHAL